MDQDVDELQRLFSEVTSEPNGIYGLDETVRLCLVAMCADGHVLLEGNPGLGKTSLVKTLAKYLALPWGRIQFTPDLMPSDITGADMPDFDEGNQSRFQMKFLPGPIFTSLLLADEINRASPKTQAAMLEAMAERQVTAQGKTYRLNDPFMVMATQNPLDYEGTYELPKAQADRFMMKLFVHLPGQGHLLKIMAKDTAPRAAKQPDAIDRSARRNVVNRLRIKLREQTPPREVKEHIATIVLASNGQSGNKTLDAAGLSLFEYGFSPRAASALQLAAQGWVYLWPALNPGVAHADGAALATVLLPVLRHRTVLRDTHYGSGGPAETNDIIDGRLRDFCGQCAAGLSRTYRDVFQRAVATAQ